MIFQITSQIVRFLENSNDQVAVEAANALTMSSSTFRMGEKDVCGYFQRLSESTLVKDSAKLAMFKDLGWSPARPSRATYNVSEVKGRSYAVKSSR